MTTKDWDEKYGAFQRGAVKHAKCNTPRDEKPDLAEAQRDAHRAFVRLVGKRPIYVPTYATP